MLLNGSVMHITAAGGSRLPFEETIPTRIDTGTEMRFPAAVLVRSG